MAGGGNAGASGAAGRRPFGERLLSAVILAGLFVTLVAEGLSLFGAFRFPFVAAAWAAGAVAACAWLFRGRGALAGAWPELRAGLGLETGLYAAACGVLLAGTFAVALASPPNTNDSLTYHMSRVAHWVQNGSVAHYPTAMASQLYSPPFAEYAVAELQVLAGGDRLANLVQWAAFAGLLLGVAAVAGELGAAAGGMGLAALLAGTLPAAVLQASSTQNGLVLSLWAVAFVHRGLVLRRDPRLRQALLLGAALGLAFLTKLTAYSFLAPFGLWFALDAVRARRYRTAFLLALGLAAALLVSSGSTARNLRHFGAPFSTPAATAYHAAVLRGPLDAASNVVRGAGLELDFPSPSVRAFLESAIVAAHRAAGVDPDEPRLTIAGQRFAIPPAVPHEDLAGSPFHLLLLVPVLALALSGGIPDARPFVLALLAGTVLHASMLKWQPWDSRYHVTLFVLAAPVAAAWLALRTPPRLRLAVSAVLFALALRPLLANASRPLLPGRGNVFAQERAERLFVGLPGARPPFEAVAAFLRERDARSVGLVIDESCYEYPYWVLLKDRSGRTPRIEHVALDSLRGSRWARLGGDLASRPEVDPGFRPDAIVRDLTRGSALRPEAIDYRDRRYLLALESGPLQVFVGEGISR